MQKNNLSSSRPIRSFVRRQGRITPGQQRALNTLWSKFGIDFTKAYINFDAIFQRQAAKILEIGFGMGDSLLTMAQQQPEYDFIGIEVYEPGVGHLLNLINQHQITNIRVICADAIEVIKHMIPDDSLHKIQIYFPDPWPKKRHHKRRLINASFLDLIHPKLNQQATLHLATDWEPYAEHMMTVLTSHKQFTNCYGAGQFSPHTTTRPLTKFEHRGQQRGHVIRELIFKA